MMTIDDNINFLVQTMEVFAIIRHFIKQQQQQKKERKIT